MAIAGWRSVFVGGWQVSGDGSYECPQSPWHTLLHPLPPDAFGEVLLGLPEACNRDARQVTVGWSVGLVAAVAAATVLVRRQASAKVRSKDPSSPSP